MKNTIYLLLVIIFSSCTSNTIFEKPKDLIPKDSMSLLVQEMLIASSSKFFKNKDLQKNIDYMPFVYDRFQIDSVRFQSSNMYYMTKIDEYQEIFDDAKAKLEAKKKLYDDMKTNLDSIRKDSIKKLRIEERSKISTDSLKKILKINSTNINLDTLSQINS
jgi:hypothetical protein